MAIRVNYTPYGAVGGLAEHAGQAQQAIREQQYKEQQARQAENIAAQERMQAERIGAGREEWQKKLAVQQEQFATGQATRQEEMFRRQQASEFAAMKQSQDVNARIQAEQERFKQNVEIKERGFELQRAQETRLLQSAQANIRAQETRSAFDLKKLDVAKTGIAENLADWKKMQGQVSPEEYVAGTIAISQGKIPKTSADTNTLIDEKRRLDIEKKKLAMSAGLTDRSRTVAQEVFEDVFGGYAGAIRGAWTGMDEDELIDNYKSYQAKTGYSSKNDVSKRELDNVFDRSIIDYENKGWFDYYSAWDPESKAVKDLRIQSKGPIPDAEMGKIITDLQAKYPNASKEQLRPLATAEVAKRGWEL